MDEPRALFARVHGVVQGVGFRYATVARARRLDLTGYVRNIADGNVEILAEGSQTDLDRLLRWLAKGPSYAHVTRVDHNYRQATKAYTQFNVAY